MNDLGYVRYARWVPHLLTDDQKQSRVRLATQVIEKYDKCDLRRLEEIVTGDETWIFHFNPILRLKIRFGFHPRVTDLSLHAVAKHQIAFCMRYSDSKGPVLQIPVPKGSSVTGKFYRESVLTQLDFYQKHRSCTSVRGIKLLHDNALAHKSAMVQEYLKESRSSPIQP